MSEMELDTNFLTFTTVRIFCSALYLAPSVKVRDGPMLFQLLLPSKSFKSPSKLMDMVTTSPLLESPISQPVQL
jgi:hypothetical protein